MNKLGIYVFVINGIEKEMYKLKIYNMYFNNINYCVKDLILDYYKESFKILEVLLVIFGIMKFKKLENGCIFVSKFLEKVELDK